MNVNGKFHDETKHDLNANETPSRLHDSEVKFAYQKTTNLDPPLQTPEQI